MAETKKCEVCDQEIGATEKVCPKCGTDFEELEEAVSVIELANKVTEKRRKARETPPPNEPPPTTGKKKGAFSSLAKALKK